MATATVGQGSTDPAWNIEDHILGAIYGNCIGDAIGLMTEFMNKPQAKGTYIEHAHLEYEHKYNDMHRCRWKNGDWTDDSDQMILIMDMLLDHKGSVDHVDYAKRLIDWARHGFPELGDQGGMGIGATTKAVLHHDKYLTDPHFAAEDIWKKTKCFVAPNGAVMRTSVLGIHQYQSTDAVIENTKQVCKVTHADPRCVASCVAVVSAISFMLQRQPQHMDKDGKYNTEAIIKDAYNLAKPHLKGKNYRSHKKELKAYMFAKNLSVMKLDDFQSIGYTYKALGAGFWMLRQTDFRTALEELVMEGGDADSNGSVAGALLGCKLGAKELPPTWRDNLLHKDWLDNKINKFLALQNPPLGPLEWIESQPSKSSTETEESVAETLDAGEETKS